MARPVPTSMLKAVAEAAVAYRTGSEVFVVAHFEYPHERRVFFTYDGTTNPESDAEAFLASQDNKDDWQQFGPFVTEPEGKATQWTALNYRTTLEITSPEGEQSTQIFDPDDEVDAIFLTLPAIDKFVLPYYTTVFGVERAFELRREYVENPGPRYHARSRFDAFPRAPA